MGTTFTATTSSAEAPNIEDGVYDARFDGTEATRVKGGQYTKDTVNGDPKLRWNFTVLDDDGDVLYDEGDPIVLDKLTGVGFNTAAKTVPGELLMLKALMTPAEYAEFEAGKGTDEDSLKGRTVQIEVFTKADGWKGIGKVIAARKRRSTAKA